MMTTPTDGEWMSAHEARESLVSAGIPYQDAASAICARAHVGLIKARAKRFIRNRTASDDAEVPAEFWWAKGGKALKQNWATGDFETPLQRDMRIPDYGRVGRLQAYGVEFLRSDVDQLKPPSIAPAAPPSPAQRRAGRTVFIGHGHSEEWRKLYIYLRDSHGLSVREFNSGSSPVGISITNHLQSMLDQADFAFLILTGDDLQATGELNPRLNVVHEAGLFQGTLGFRKAILFLEEGCQEFSNVRGLIPIQFPKGKIDAKFHQAVDVLNGCSPRTIAEHRCKTLINIYKY
jgi:hypothetical protein